MYTKTQLYNNKINKFINFIESQYTDIKFLNYDFKFILSTKINLSDSELYFFSYQNQIIFIVYFTEYISKSN